jgi:hypothetical protein
VITSNSTYPYSYFLILLLFKFIPFLSLPSSSYSSAFRQLPPFFLLPFPITTSFSPLYTPLLPFLVLFCSLKLVFLTGLENRD